MAPKNYGPLPIYGDPLTNVIVIVLVYLPVKAFPGTLTFSVAWIVKVPTPWLPPDVLLKKVTAGLPAVTVRGYPIALPGQVDPLHDDNTVTPVIVEARGKV
jgi:hypothetical protein